MPRRNRKSPVEGFIDLAARLPWWVCIGLAALSYFTLNALAVSAAPVVQSSTDMANAIIPIMLRAGAQVGQYVLPMLFTVGAILSGIHSFRQRGMPDLPSTVGRLNAKTTFSTPPACPQCNAPMAQRRARRDNHAGDTFWGCTQYPSCKGTRPLA